MRQNQKGAILIFVVVIIGVIGILYSSIYIIIGIENRIQKSLEYRTKAYYVAESGLEKGLATLKESSNVNPFSCENPFTPQYKQNHQFSVIFEQPQINIYRITSTGTYVNTKRTIEAVVFKDGNTFLIQSLKEINN